MADRVTLRIDGQTLTVPSGTTLLDAARRIGADIPTLCRHDGLSSPGSCRLCLVEAIGRPLLVPACVTPAADGMEILTSSEKVRRVRATILELWLADHPANCRVEAGETSCEIEKVAAQSGVTASRFPKGPARPSDHSSAVISVSREACVLCGRCIRACGELQGHRVIGLTGRGFRTRISFDLDDPMGRSTCVSCGECLSVCPTGALGPKRHAGEIADAGGERKTVDTVCPFCGVGCRLTVQVRNNSIVRVTSPRQALPNRGRLCVKGRFGLEYAGHPDRLTVPLIRKEGTAKGSGGRSAFREASWDEALDLAARRFSGLKEKRGAQALAGLSSAKCSNEVNYLFQKFVRTVFGTNSVDHCARLCHATSVAAMVASLGDGASTNSIDDILSSDFLFVAGSNTPATHPVIATFFHEAVSGGAALAVVDPRRTELARIAQYVVRPRPGTDAALFGGLAALILERNLYDKRFVPEQTEGIEALREALRGVTPEVTERETGVPAAVVVDLAESLGRARRPSFYWGMGLAQHSHGTLTVHALINLGLLVGAVGRRGVGLNPLRGQNNVQGACDMGALPAFLPGYSRSADPEGRAKFEAPWGVPLPAEPGLTVVEMMHAAREGRVRGMYVMGENPVMSDPNLPHVREGLAALSILVLQDIFFTETAEYADIILPAAGLLEVDGTITNTERRIQRVRPAVRPAGHARPDIEILADLAGRMGRPIFAGEPTAAAVMEEIAGLLPAFAGVHYDRLGENGLQWPCLSRDHAGTPVLHARGIKRGKARFVPVGPTPGAEQPDEAYPYVLNTGRILEHYQTGTMTRRTVPLPEIAPENLVEMNPEDAAREGIAGGEEVDVVTRRGSIRLPVLVTDRCPRGSLFTTFHFREAAANVLTNDALDPTAKEPEYKFCAAKVVRRTALETPA
ncbi:MAG: formate dehydrogenase subunit alpha [Nitrospirota bacterium]